MVNNKMKWLSLMFLFLFMVSACHHNNNLTHSKVVTVTKEKLETTIFYAGVIQPLKTVVVTSPTEGVVEELSFHYGDEVKSGQPLFIIASDKFQTDYKNALTQYIKTKTEFNNAETQLSESEFLHKNQLISEDEFQAKQNSFYTAQLTLLQAKDALALMLKQLNVTDLNLYTLSIKDIDKITAALHLHEGDQKLHVRSPERGVALLPIKSDSNDNQVKRIAKGEQVKQGDVLAMIGDVSGLSIHVNVNEFNINQLTIGQKVMVTGTAFPQFILSGEIASIDRQGETSQGGMPSFPVEIIVPKLTKAEQAVIHIGMSAKVAIHVEGEPVVKLPIEAVFEKNGEAFVKILTAEKKIREVPVKTGPTTAEAVVILDANLKLGEQVVIPN